jgi:hypothetical protein
MRLNIICTLQAIIFPSALPHTEKSLFCRRIFGKQLSTMAKIITLHTHPLSSPSKVGVGFRLPLSLFKLDIRLNGAGMLTLRKIPKKSVQATPRGKCKVVPMKTEGIELPNHPPGTIA